MGGTISEQLQLTPALGGMIAVVVSGVCLFIFGLRGRRVGDHPHCRKCGFDLFGAPPESSRCPECGADLAAAKASVVGVRRRRGRWILLGLLLMAGGLVPLGMRAKTAAGRVEWVRYYPVSWLIKDFDGPLGPARDTAGSELCRRIRLADPEGDLVPFIDHLLADHAADNRRWDNLSTNLLTELQREGRIDSARLMKLLENSARLRLTTRAKIRRGSQQHASVSVQFPRLPFTLQGQYKSTPLKLGQAAVSKYVLSERSVPNDPNIPNLASSTTMMTLEVDSPEVRAMPLGATELSFKATFELQLKQAPEVPPVKFEKSLTVPVELVAEDAILDNFVADPADRESVEASVKEVAAIRTADSLVVQTRVTSPKVPLAMEVMARPSGAGDSEQWRRIGELMVTTGPSDSWHACPTTQPAARDLVGRVDVRLRPSQAAADRMVPSPSSIWGGEIVRRDVAVRQASPATDFVHDESLRAAVTKAVKIERVRVSPAFPGKLSLSIHVGANPVSVSYEAFVRMGETEVRAGDMHIGSSHGAQVMANKSFGGMGYGMLAKLPDPEHPPDKIDVILRPKPYYGFRAGTDTPPWAGELIFTDVPVEKPAAKN